MTEVWTALQASDLAIWVGFSRWGYAAVATGHVLGVAILFGSILTFDLRLMGIGRAIGLDALSRLIVPVAAVGLAFAVATGALLFIGRAATYAGYELFQIKMALIAIAMGVVLFAHRRYGLRLQRATARQRFRIGLASLSLWVCVLVSGRMIAFVHG